MPQSDTNRMALSYGKEATFGVSPTTSGFYRFLRLVSHSLQQDTTTGASSEVVSDRNITKVRRLGIDGSGDIVCELSKDTGFEELMQSALQDPTTWTPLTPINTTISTLASSVINDTGAGLGSVDVGDYVLLHGFDDAGINRPWKVTVATDASNITVLGTLPIEAAGAAKVFVQGVAIRNNVTAAGTAIDSYSFEEEFTDLTNEFALYKGTTIDGFTIDVSAEGFITITFATMGAGEESPRPAAQKDGGTRIAAGTALQFTAVDDVVAILDSDLEQCVSTFSIVVANNNHARKAVGTAGPKSIGTGMCQVTGSLTTLFEDATEVDKHLAYEETDLALLLFNGTQSAYVFEVPSLQYSKGATPNTGQSQDVIADLPWEAQQETTALAGETVRAAIRVWKFY